MFQQCRSCVNIDSNSNTKSLRLAITLECRQASIFWQPSNWKFLPEDVAILPNHQDSVLYHCIITNFKELFDLVATNNKHQVWGYSSPASKHKNVKCEIISKNLLFALVAARWERI